MTQDEIIDMAKQAGINNSTNGLFFQCDKHDLNRFAKLVAAKERERIFDMLHEMHAKEKGRHNHYLHAVVTLKQKVKHERTN